MTRSNIQNIILFLAFIITVPTTGQIISTQAVYIDSTDNRDNIFIYETIQNISLRHETSETVTYEWAKHNPADNSWTPSSNTQTGTATTLIINEPGGYQLKYTDSQGEHLYRCWAFEPVISNPNIEITKENCDGLSLIANYEHQPMIYYDPITGNTSEVDYKIEVEWISSVENNISSSSREINLSAPVDDTKYEVKITPFKIDGRAITAALDYTALAVKADYEGNEEPPNRGEGSNEIHKGLMEGSAPIEVRFTDKSKGHINAWEWTFTSSGITKSDQNPFHVFTTIGVQDSVLLTVRNQFSGCEDTSDPLVIVHAFESAIEAPNAFTPQGPSNNEFRVAYRSIKKFDMIIFNRWGKAVYRSTNPAEGWDGTIGRTLAAPGVYFYTIEAEGFRKEEKHKLQGPIHLIRGK